MSKIRIILSLALTLLFVQKGNTQNTNYEITPGYGVDQIHIGMHIDSLQNLIGKPDVAMSYHESIKWVKSLGFSPSVFLEYRNNFDSAYYYIKGSEKAELPVFAVFTKYEKIVYLKLSSKKSKIFAANNYKNKWVKQFKLSDNKNIGFNTRQTIIEEDLNSIIVLSNTDKLNPKFEFASYLTFGVGFTYYKNKVTLIEIFKKGVDNYRTPITPYKQIEP